MLVGAFIEFIQVSRNLMARHGKDLDEPQLKLLSGRVSSLEGKEQLRCH
jgi:hypothetical protein